MEGGTSSCVLEGSAPGGALQSALEGPASSGAGALEGTASSTLLFFEETEIQKR